jgi:hypothetical protein
MTLHVAIKCATNLFFRNATLLYCNFLQNLFNYLKKAQFWQNSLVPQTSIQKFGTSWDFQVSKWKSIWKCWDLLPCTFSHLRQCVWVLEYLGLYSNMFPLSCQNLGDKPKTMVATFFFQIFFHFIALLVILGQVMSSFSTLSWLQY